MLAEFLGVASYVDTFMQCYVMAQSKQVSTDLLADE